MNEDVSREEIVAQWKQRQEEDQARFEKRPWEMSKLIKVRAHQRLVVTKSLMDRLWGIIFLVILGGGGVGAAIVWSLPLYGAFLLVAVMVGMGLFICGYIIGKKTIIDKPSQSISIETRPFLLFKRQYSIPLSSVVNVVIDYERTKSNEGSHDSWEVSLNTIGDKVSINHSDNSGEMYSLARGISSYIGKELKVNRGNEPDPFMFPKKTFDSGNLPRDWKL